MTIEKEQKVNPPSNSAAWLFKSFLRMSTQEISSSEILDFITVAKNAGNLTTEMAAQFREAVQAREEAEYEKRNKAVMGVLIAMIGMKKEEIESAEIGDLIGLAFESNNISFDQATGLKQKIEQRG